MGPAINCELVSETKVGGKAIWMQLSLGDACHRECYQRFDFSWLLLGLVDFVGYPEKPMQHKGVGIDHIDVRPIGEGDADACFFLKLALCGQKRALLVP